MKRCNIATAAVLRSLNCSLTGDTMEMALTEYKVFLVQDAGVPLGYGFRWNWTVGCPFSDDLGLTSPPGKPGGFVGGFYDHAEHERIKTARSL